MGPEFLQYLAVRVAGEGATAPCHRKRRREAGEGKAKKNLAYLNQSMVAGPVLGRSGRGAVAGPTAPPVPGFQHHLSDLPSAGGLSSFGKNRTAGKKKVLKFRLY